MNILNFLFGSAKVVNTDLVLGEIALALIVWVLALIVPFIVKKVVKKQKPGWQLLWSLCKIIGYTGLLVVLTLFLRFEAIYPFETRGWTTVAILGALIAAVVVLLRYRRVAPTLVVDTSRFEKYDKYLPEQRSKGKSKK